MANYNSIHTGPQIDEAVRRALENGDIDQALALVKATAEAHAARHSADGADPIDPVGIGAFGTHLEIPGDDANNIVDDGIYRVRSTTKNVDQASNGTMLLAFSWDENTRAQMIFHNTRVVRFRTSQVGVASNWSAWDGLLPLSGGTLTGQAIRFYNGYGKVIAGNGTIQMTAYTDPADETNMTSIILSDKQTLDKAARLIVKENGVSTYYNLFGEHNVGLYGMGGGLTLLKRLTVPEEGIEELEFQLTVEELTRYKRFVIFPKLEVEYDTNATRSVFLEAPSFGSDGLSLSIGPVSLFPTNSVAFIAVGTEGSGWGYTINMLSLKTYHSTTEGATAVHTDQTYGTSTNLHPNPTTDPLTFRIIAYYPFIKGGTVSIMGVN